jgi:hypothetical protein
MSGRLSLAMIAAALSACASPVSHVMTGAAHAPISPDQVVILSRPPPVYEDVAILHASSKSTDPTSQAAFDKVVQRLKEQAALLGANAVVLEGFSDRQTATIGTGVGSSSYSPHSAVGVGVGGGFGIYSKSGQGRAVYIPPGAPQPLMVPLGPPPPGTPPAPGTPPPPAAPSPAG